MKSCGSLSAMCIKSPMSAQRFDSDGALVGLGQDAVLVEYAAGCAAYTRCGVVKVQGDIASTLQLVLIDGLGQVIGSAVVCVEVEVLIHAEFQTLARVVGHANPAVIGPQAVILRDEVAIP